MRIASWALGSETSRSNANDRRSPVKLYWRAGHVRFRPVPDRHSQMLNPTSLSPEGGPVWKTISAPASLPGVAVSVGLCRLLHLERSRNRPVEDDSPRRRRCEAPPTGSLAPRDRSIQRGLRDTIDHQHIRRFL